MKGDEITFYRHRGSNSTKYTYPLANVLFHAAAKAAKEEGVRRAEAAKKGLEGQA